ncbi:MAG: sensor histidine kinase [Oscillospiraceae bacterium]|nr:sensor histidine kinase [Oscillospiraceae bacterium]
MSKHLKNNVQRYRPFAALPLIILVIYALWLGLPEGQYSSVYSKSGTWDLRSFNFDNATASIHGRVDNISAPFLLPDEFSTREDEISRRYPSIGSTPSTVRVRFLLPYDEYYIISRISTGYADRIYVNGEWMQDIGDTSPEAAGILYSPTITFIAKPVNGVIEIIHQDSNFIYHVHGIYESGMPDEYNIGNDISTVTYTTNIILGVLISLTIVSLLIFMLLHSYRPVLLFSLLCLAWFFYTGAMGAKVFVTIMPWFTDPLRIRLMLNITPITVVLMAAIISDMFPGIFHKYIIRTVIGLFSAWIICFMIADIGFILRYGLLVCMSMAAVIVAYGIITMLIKVRKPDILTTVFIIGFIILGYPSIRDILTYLNLNVGGIDILLPPFGGANFARVGVIGFLLCQAASIFIATMNEMKETKQHEQEAKERERKISNENAALESLARMKTEYLSNISHEIKTPLTVIYGNIQEATELFDELRVENGVAIVDGETILSSLQKAQSEILRLTRITENSLRISSMQESRERMQILDTAKFFTESAELYNKVIEKNNNTLVIQVMDNLPAVYGSADLLNQVLANLFSNANKHTHNGYIVLRVEKGDSRFVRVCVNDTGEGIPADILSAIFKRGISYSDGTGIGLPICKEIIESHGGTIELASEPREGTRVTFTVPVFGNNIFGREKLE